MKTLRLITGLILSVNTMLSYSQNVGINDDNSAPDPSAMLDVKSSDKGILIPRITLNNLNNADPITNPAVGLLIYANSESSVAEGFYYWSGTKWERIGSNIESNQTLSVSGNKLTISNGNTVYLDADSTNELQNLSQVLSRGNDAGSNRIANLGDPINDDDAVTKSYLMDLIDGLSGNSIYLEDFNSITEWQPMADNSSGCSFTASDGFAQIASMSYASGWVYAKYATNLPLLIPPGTDFSLKAHIIVMDGDPSSTLSMTGVMLINDNDERIVYIGHNDSQASSGYGGIQINCEGGSVFDGDAGGFSTEYPEFAGILEIRRVGNVYTAYVNGELRGTLTSGTITRTATQVRIHNGRYSSYGYRDGKIDFILITLL